MAWFRSMLMRFRLLLLSTRCVSTSPLYWNVARASSRTSALRFVRHFVTNACVMGSLLLLTTSSICVGHISLSMSLFPSASKGISVGP